MPTNITPLWTQHRQLDYANNSVGSGRPWTTRLVGITFTFTAALDSCSMTASTGTSNLYLNERRLGAARRHGKCQRDHPGPTFLAIASSEPVGSIAPTTADRLSGCPNLCGCTVHRRERRDDRTGHFPESGILAIVSMASSGDRVRRGVVLDRTTNSGAKGIFDVSNSGRKSVEQLRPPVDRCQRLSASPKGLAVAKSLSYYDPIS